MTDTRSPELPRWLVWWVPYTFVVVIAALALFWPESIRAWIGGELGVMENLEVAALVASLWVALLAMLSPEVRRHRGLRIWVGLFLLGNVYVLGEEISWGQHYFGWGTPEWYQAVNDQQETNLHNTSSWLDQKPRALLELAIYYTVLVHPWLRRRWNPPFLARVPAWAWPTPVTLPAALLILLSQLLDSSPLGRLGTEIGLRLSEVRETLVYFFLYCYIYSLYRRRAALTA